MQGNSWTICNNCHMKDVSDSKKTRFLPKMDTTIKCFLTSQTSIRFWHLLHLLPRVHAWGYEVGALHYAYSHRCWKKEMEICRSINTQTPQNIRGKELRKFRRKPSLHTPNFNNVGTEKSEKWNKKLSRKPKKNLLAFKIALLIYARHQNDF